METLKKILREIDVVKIDPELTRKKPVDEVFFVTVDESSYYANIKTKEIEGLECTKETTEKLIGLIEKYNAGWRFKY